jgi:hypothetical protein
MTPIGKRAIELALEADAFMVLTSTLRLKLTTYNFSSTKPFLSFSPFLLQT